MRWKLLAGGLGVALVVVVVFLAVVVGIVWFLTDDRPLAYYDARPAVVDEAGLAETGYLWVNDTAVNLVLPAVTISRHSAPRSADILDGLTAGSISYSPVPYVGRDVRVRSWVTVYAKGATLPSDPPTAPNATVSLILSDKTS